ncbi:MAG: type II toxin-antitoxin system antitoxin SocA domain-containing protein [Solirubrobacteraceae bacterium]
MSSVDDVAAYILAKEGEMTTWKLQKLVYYSQAWSLVWDGKALFSERIEAWANGPVVRALYDRHKGKFTVKSWRWGKASALTQAQQDTIDAVLKTYGKRPPHALSQLTHTEPPWKNARAGLPSDARSTRTISRDAMADYYGSL